MNSPFPPTFANSPVSYAAALIGDMLTSGFSLTILLHYFFEGRRFRRARRIADREIDNLFPIENQVPYPGARRSWRTLVSLNRIIMGGFMLGLVCRATPDVIWMLAWDEASPGVMKVLFLIDYAFDFLAIIPLLGSAVMWAWARGSISQQLAKADYSPLPPPTLIKMSNFLKISGLVVALAILVTIGKASA